MTDDAAIDVRDLHVLISGRNGASTSVLRGVSLTVSRGEIHGLIGETGSGKSMTGRAVMRILPSAALIEEGLIKVNGEDVLAIEEERMRKLRAASVAMVFQNPRTALHPMISVESQMGAVVDAHLKVTRRARAERIRRYLSLCGIADADRVAHAYPHALSGGLAQRVCIATALICEPSVLIADEPTTGLDATVQRRILDLLAELQRQMHLSVLLITHDLGAVAQYCDSMSVMSDGVIVESGAKHEVLTRPQHEYTRSLLEASRLEGATEARRAARERSR